MDGSIDGWIDTQMLVPIVSYTYIIKLQTVYADEMRHIYNMYRYIYIFIIYIKPGSYNFAATGFSHS